MSVHTTDETMTTGSTTVDFFRFVVPSILGLVALSSAGIVDGIFVGNYVGATALAAVNLVVPLYSVFFGLCVMMLVGGAVVAGKALGEGDTRTASNIFTKSLTVVVIFALIVASLAWYFAGNIAAFVGAEGEALPLTTEYIRIISPFMFFMGLAYALSYFSRVDDAPNYALFGLVLTAFTNIVLDALFIKVWGWGISGAAFASGIAYTVGTAFLMVRFFGRQARIRLIKPYGSWFELFRAAYNGFSEFINEMSGGLIMFVINWILMIEAGTTGVAAFTIVNYILWLSIMMAYGTAEALGPLVSVNFGARKPERIANFMRLAVGLAVLLGITFATALLVYPEALASVFIQSDEVATLALTLSIIAVIWPAFLFNGINITLSGYFTGMHAATQSALIAMSRSLVLPLVLIILFWKTLGLEGAFLALPVAEILTFALSVVLFYRATPGVMVGKDMAVSDSGMVKLGGSRT
ncbi:MATE family efflux transporter [Endozoicomonas sp. SESOKO1]|uniref:MATE family efflux transporter n=1 Tax=Endozoicomonas sp. SESOKO1 TaxID=2828742 RepID=UPI00214880DE|nr:MATE family efflux transporter [Endozoicomonas sp. SESOKO1]